MNIAPRKSASEKEGRSDPRKITKLLLDLAAKSFDKAESILYNFKGV